MTIKERILEYLTQHPEGASDGELAAHLQIGHQHANNCCTGLRRQGRITRVRTDGIIRNHCVGNQIPKPGDPGQVASISDPNKPWFWEGNVAQQVADHLSGMDGCTIVQLANTKSRQPGKDIVANQGNDSIWVTVKGYPEGTQKTRASTQAEHWFKQALFDMIHWRGQAQHAKLFLALPDFRRYRALADKIAWLIPTVPFGIIWVSEDGDISGIGD